MERIFTILILSIVLFLYSCRQNSDEPFNLDFERVKVGQTLPDRWTRWGDNDYTLAIDAAVKQHGNYSVMITSASGMPKNRSAGFITPIPVRVKSGEIILEGYIRTEAITNGFAGLVLQTDQADKILDYRDMHEQHLDGNNNWKKYSVSAPCRPGITEIYVGGTLSGSGKAWFDSFNVLINDVSIGNSVPENN